MTNRLNLERAIVVPWQLPEIDAGASQRHSATFLETELGAPPSIGIAPPQLAVPNLPEASPPPPSAEPPDAEAHAEGLERGLREGREQGYADGFAAGRNAAEEQFAAQLDRLEAIVGRLGEPIRSLERPVEEAVIALALEIARWVIGNQINVSRDFLVQLVRDAVARVPIDVGVPAIMLHPADAELIRALAPELENGGIPLVADDAIEPGGCLIVANGDESVALKDRRWHPRARQAVCEVDLTLASRWRDAMFAMFEGEDA